ncbi:hypothetical protein [Streptomyces sp. NPDC006012]|uniref:hypothetical protein n=1 Tax=Streptomyces sp. NPDC006012 TaxID=3364739 RepID=UPI00367AFE2E
MSETGVRQSSETSGLGPSGGSSYRGDAGSGVASAAVGRANAAAEDPRGTAAFDVLSGSGIGTLDSSLVEHGGRYRPPWRRPSGR